MEKIIMEKIVLFAKCNICGKPATELVDKSYKNDHAIHIEYRCKKHKE